MPCLAGHVGEAALVHHQPGIGDGAVHPAHFCDRFGKCLDHAGLVSNVHNLRKDAGAELRELRQCRIVRFLAAPPDDDVAASLGNSAGETKPDSGIASGDYDNLSAHVPWQLRHRLLPESINILFFNFAAFRGHVKPIPDTL